LMSAVSTRLVLLLEKISLLRVLLVSSEFSVAHLTSMTDG
jgi:hypothetical protein